jgi:hypothetical protein
MSQALTHAARSSLPVPAAPRTIDRPSPPVWLGPLVRARTGSIQDLVQQPGSPRGAYVLRFCAPLTAMWLVGHLLPIQNAVVAPILTGLLAGALALAPVQLTRWQRRRRMKRHPFYGRIGDVPEGTVVRLSGTIEPDRAAFPALGEGKPAVFVRTLFPLSGQAVGGPGLREDVRGVPFHLRMRDGTLVRLDPATLHTVDLPPVMKSMPLDLVRQLSAVRPRRLNRSNYRQLVFSPGDHIEVLGRLNRSVDPAGQAAPGRGVPMAFTLSPVPDGGVMLRKRRPF